MEVLEMENTVTEATSACDGLVTDSPQLRKTRGQ